MAIQNSAMGVAIEELLHKQEISDVLMRYCRSVDRMDWDSVRACYHPDAIDEHGLYNGPVDGFIEFFQQWAGEQYKVAMHMIGNVLIDIRGSQAVSESYSITHLRLAKEKALNPQFKRLWAGETETDVLGPGVTDVDVTLGLRMIDRFERRGEEEPWLIAHRVIVHEWNRLDPVRFQLHVDGVMRSGDRDQTDLIFERLASLQTTSNSGQINTCRNGQ